MATIGSKRVHGEDEDLRNYRDVFHLFQATLADRINKLKLDEAIAIADSSNNIVRKHELITRIVFVDGNTKHVYTEDSFATLRDHISSGSDVSTIKMDTLLSISDVFTEDFLYDYIKLIQEKFKVITIINAGVINKTLATEECGIRVVPIQECDPFKAPEGCGSVSLPVREKKTGDASGEEDDSESRGDGDGDKRDPIFLCFSVFEIVRIVK